MLREWSERSEIAVESGLRQPPPLEPAVELTIFRLVQEALTNVAKYASATHVFVDLEPVGGAVKVAVRDDGVGFDMSLPRLQTHGLIGMRFRVEADGGELHVESEPGAGTLIEATLPAMPLAEPTALRPPVPSRLAVA